MLDQIFELQGDLNRLVGYDTQALKDNFDPLKAGRWLNDYVLAAMSELEELRNCTFWKHWCVEAKNGERYKIHDLQNARVEVIDLLFFCVSLAQCVGLDAHDVFQLYQKKLQVNIARQRDGYGMAEKDEVDNRSIELED